MCLLIWKPADKTVPEEWIEEAWRCNSHGAGMAFVKNGKDRRCWWLKELMKLDDLKANIDKIEKRPAILHFRIASVGKRTPENTHPFLLGNSGWVVAHNGTIGGLDIQGDESDTSAFARDVLTPLMENNPLQIFDPDTQKALEARIGGSKMVLMGPDAQKVILNERLGHWKDGVWYSNHSYVPVAKSTYTAPSYPHSHGMGRWYDGEDWDGMSEQEWQSYVAEQDRLREERRKKYGPSEIGRVSVHSQQAQGRLPVEQKKAGTYMEISCNGNWYRNVVEGIEGEWLPTKDYLERKKKEDQSLRESASPSYIAQRRRNLALRKLMKEIRTGERFLECVNVGHCNECGDEFGLAKAYYHTESKSCMCRDCAILTIQAEDLIGPKEQKEIEDFIGQGHGHHPEDSQPKKENLMEQEQIELEREEHARILGIAQHLCH